LPRIPGYGLWLLAFELPKEWGPDGRLHYADGSCAVDSKGRGEQDDNLWSLRQVPAQTGVMGGKRCPNRTWPKNRLGTERTCRTRASDGILWPEPAKVVNLCDNFSPDRGGTLLDWMWLFPWHSHCEASWSTGLLHSVLWMYLLGPRASLLP
jgi:hypothetical protein